MEINLSSDNKLAILTFDRLIEVWDITKGQLENRFTDTHQSKLDSSYMTS